MVGNRAARRLDGRRPDTDRAPVAGSTAEARAQLPAALAEAVDGFEEHLPGSRDLSEHTVRGYVGDVVRLLDHLTRRGGGTVADLALTALRRWLAKGPTTGPSRATTGRSSGAGRSFT